MCVQRANALSQLEGRGIGDHREPPEGENGEAMVQWCNHGESIGESNGESMVKSW